VLKINAAEIPRELYVAIYGQNIMNEGTVRQRRKMFKDGRKDSHDEELSVCPTVMSDDLVQIVDQICVKDNASKFQNFCDIP
jgi:hypothetical protein